MTYAARRGKERRTITGEMTITHRLAAGSDLDTATLFDASRRAAPITFEVPIYRTSSSSLDGIFLEIGTSSRGLALWSSNANQVALAVGGGIPNILEGIGATTATTSGIFPRLNHEYRCVIGIHPGRGTVRMWVDGQLILLDADDASDIRPWMKFPTAADWTDSGDGRVGDINSSTPSANYRAFPAPVATALSNAYVAGDVLAYAGQLPKTIWSL